MSDDLHPEHDLDPAVLAALDADLSAPAVWAEPPASLEDDLVAAITAEAAAAAPMGSTESSRRWLWAVAAVAFLAGGFALGTALAGDDDTPEIVGEIFPLEGTELAADADAEVELAVLLNGLRIILAVDELPPAPDGTFYEAWLLDTERGVVSAGTFHMRNQTGRIELWAGVTPEAYPRFVVTLEDDDGDPTPSSDVVFEADVSSLVDS
ncbi:MAG: anti-sigma factor [Actinomycetota bacterium]